MDNANQEKRELFREGNEGKGIMAGQQIAELYYKITGDTKDLDSSIKSSDNAVQGLGKSGLSIGKILKGAFAVAAVRAIGMFGKELISVASDAEETRNKFNVTFKDVSTSAAETAANLASSFGLSRTAAQSLLADTGDLLSGFGFTGEAALDMSTQVNELAVDLASFTNFSGGAEGASAALTKALLGEREGIKSLGISISEADIAQLAEDKGIVGELDRQTKAQLTLELAVRQSGNAVGDFARSQDSFANQSRIATAKIEDLKVSLGSNLLPVANIAVKSFNELADSALVAADKLGEFVQSEEGMTIIGDIAGTVAGTFATIGVIAENIFPPIIDFINNIIEPFRELKEETDGAGIGFQLLGAASTIVTGALNIVGTAIGAAINNFINLAEVVTSVAELVRAGWQLLTGEISKDEFFTALDATGSAFKELGVELVEGYADTFSEIKGVITGFSGDIKENADEIATAYANASEAAAATTRAAIISANEDIKEDTQTTGEEIAENNEILLTEEEEAYKGFLDRKIESYRDAMRTISEATAAAGDSITSIWGSVNDYQDNLNEEELMRLQNQVDATTTGTAERAAAEEKLDKRKREIAREQAKRDKEAAIFSAIINTAVAVVGMLADPGGVTGIVLSALAAAAGIAEIAAISSQPLPSAEQGMVVPDIAGVAASGDQQTIRVNGGERIIPADESGGSLFLDIKLDGQTIAKSTVHNYMNKGRVLLDATRGIA